MKKYIIGLFLLSHSIALFSQKEKNTGSGQPKLVVGIVVDQMRYDYLYRYWDKYGKGGFKRLLAEGFNCKNTQFNYVPTYTGPGHAAIYTGTTPSVNGIIGNDWFVRALNRNIYVVEDSTVQSVGTDSREGKMSPRNLVSTTITDELKLFNNMHSKVIGISLKDRGAILPAGHLANASYWYDGKTGHWITSSFYMKEVPSWVKEFNSQRLPDHYLVNRWNTLLPIGEYWESLPDTQPYKLNFLKGYKNQFPHDLPSLKDSLGYGLLRTTPFGNSFTVDFAIKSIQAEKLGAGKFTDFLALSFSSTDYVGHTFGVHSIELEDTYLRLDKDIERFLTFLDHHLGKENILLFLTADHAAAYTPSYLKSINLYADVLGDEWKDRLSRMLEQKFGPGKWVLAFQNSQIYLNKAIIKNKNQEEEIKETCVLFIQTIEGVSQVFRGDQLPYLSSTYGWVQQIQNGYHSHRSGDICMVLEPGWFEGKAFKDGGTTHGSVYTYDTHVPLVWYGWKIKQGTSGTLVNITDIAPTLAGLLNITEPNGSNGKNLEDMLKK